MKAIIWIIILLLIGWGIWYFVRDAEPVETSVVPTQQVESDTEIDLGEFQDKG